MPYDFVVLQIPALDLPILAAAKQIRMLRADGHTAHSAHMTGERELQFAAGQVPDLDHTIASAGGEPLVARLHGDASHPAQMAGDDARQFQGACHLGLGMLGAFFGINCRWLAMAPLALISALLLAREARTRDVCVPVTSGAVFSAGLAPALYLTRLPAPLAHPLHCHR